MAATRATDSAFHWLTLSMGANVFLKSLIDIDEHSEQTEASRLAGEPLRE